MSEQLSTVQRKNRRTLFLVAFFGIAPVVLAYILFYFFPDTVPKGQRNYGTLYEQALPLEGLVDVRDSEGATRDVGFVRGKWSFVMFLDGECAATCERNLYNTRQVRLAVGRDSLRVHRILLSTQGGVPVLPESLAAQHPDLQRAAIIGLRAELMAKFATPDAPVDTQAGVIYLIDPIGNLMMRFEDIDPSLMLKDLHRLLKVSTVG